MVLSSSQPSLPPNRSEFAGWDLHPPESAALSRRTPQADLSECVSGSGYAPLCYDTGMTAEMVQSYRITHKLSN